MEFRGTGIGQGVAVGPVVRMAERLPEPVDRPSHLDAAREEERARASLSVVAAELERKGRQAGGAAQDVLEAQAMMAEDPTLVDDIVKRLADGKTAERAVFEAFASFRDLLASMGGYMGERAADLDDVSQRVVAHLLKVPAPGVPNPGHPFVLVARDLAPADTALLDLTQVLGLVTIDGGPTSHTAILAREKSIVAVVGAADAAALADGDTVVVDAANDLVVQSPSPDEVAAAQERIAERAARAAAPVTPGALADGTPVPLLANLGSADGAAEAVELGAEGVGLFRTEFLFLDANTAPSVTEQQEQYTRLLSAFAGKKVVVRVLDAGADKPLSFLNDAHEENPALGLRGIRALRHSEVILREQLTALAAADAATEADLWVMAPMIATVEETRYFTELCRELGIQVAGVMVETPSAALIAGHILKVADFASIGTNDLTQYTMAADRLLGTVANLQDAWHPSVLHLVKHVGDAGRADGRPVGICGEAAADPLLAVVLVGLGATSLSMSPSALADVRASLARYTREDAERIARAALVAEGAAEAKSAARQAAESAPTPSGTTVP
ncbi:phosphotransferase system enzyme I (PtsI) [Agromyces flavus]|uniref:Phosphoenolpyruvate-protein phosphotransferase n=1 Tax=Agromyces flavus TaxID=589382 RepID=A0A1H1LPJ8_9MICO|nr:phosphoenolpyruvate--protein phosphotransferase [Agromyces flavus]MCP2368590.1 phosphotransferase system enzyme I (PtsI) [Agromyces flavus]GGI48169.1 phosphoenolpyruvate-protein phosphotransferase [Agromyces flavus]SDR76503.1 phosphoenolpyruvate--protein phosphotransferase [Agromyces flavus]